MHIIKPKKIKYLNVFSLPTNSKIKFEKIEEIKKKITCVSLTSEINVFSDKTDPGNQKLKQNIERNRYGSKIKIFFNM